MFEIRAETVDVFCDAVHIQAPCYSNSCVAGSSHSQSWKDAQDRFAFLLQIGDL
jgi:hypothetical protein